MTKKDTNKKIIFLKGQSSIRTEKINDDWFWYGPYKIKCWREEHPPGDFETKIPFTNSQIQFHIN